MLRRLVWLSLLGLTCARLPDGVLFQCEPDGGCLQPNHVCSARNLCEAIDAGAVATDGGLSDAGVSDAGELDAGDVDAGDVDAGAPIDAGDVDAGAAADGGDAGALDAGLGCRTACIGECGPEDAGAGCAPLFCGSCSLGLTCGGGVCGIQPACSDGWCAETPLPQGNDLMAVWANPLRRGGAPWVVWGGQRGVVFEWDGEDTRFNPLPDATGTIVGFASLRRLVNDTVLVAVTDLGDIYSRLNGRWAKTATVPNVNRDALTPCVGFANTSSGSLLSCTTLDGGIEVATLSVTAPSVEAIPAPCSDPLAIAELAPGLQALLTCRVANSNSVFLRSGNGPWLPHGRFDYGSGFIVHAMAHQGRFWGFLHYGGAVTTLIDAGTYLNQATVDPKMLVFDSVALNDGRRALLGERLIFVDANGGLQLELDGGFATVPDLSSTTPRKWTAAVLVPEGVFAVGAFGATALFPLDGGQAVLRSSPAALRATDLCGTEDGGRLYVTHSAGPNFRFGVYRPDDLVDLRETDAFDGVSQRIDGEWSRFSDPRLLDAGWDPLLDQCWVDETGALQTASPYGMTRFPLAGTPSYTPTPWMMSREQPSYSQFWASSQRRMASIASSSFVAYLEGASPVQYRDNTGFAGSCTPAGLGSELACPSGTTMWHSINGGPFGSDPLGFPGVQSFFGSVSGNTFWMVRDDGVGRTTVWRRPPCVGGPCMPFQQEGGSLDAGTLSRAMSLWVDGNNRPAWLRYSTYALTNGVLPRDLTLWLETFPQADGGFTQTQLPGWVYVPRLDYTPMNLWGTPDKLFVQWQKGVISRAKP